MEQKKSSQTENKTSEKEKNVFESCIRQNGTIDIFIHKIVCPLSKKKKFISKHKLYMCVYIYTNNKIEYFSSHTDIPA